MLINSIEEKMKVLKDRQEEVVVAVEDMSSDWFKAKIQINRLGSDFQNIVDQAVERNPKLVKMDKKGDYQAITVRMATTMGNETFLQVIEKNKSLDNARYIMCEKEGNRSYIRDLVQS